MEGTDLTLVLDIINFSGKLGFDKLNAKLS